MTIAAPQGDGVLVKDAIFTFKGRSRKALEPRAWSGLSQFLLILAIVFIAKQLMMVVIFPPFSGHDEVAHFNFIATVATEHRVPVLLVDEIPDYYYRYCQFILDWSPCEPDNLRWLQDPFRLADWGGGRILAAGEQYAANHPPLYYLVMTPLYWLTASASPETQQYLIRAASIPFGLLTVLFAYFTVRVLFPRDRFLAVTVPVIVAFQPQVSYEAAMVNNDTLAIALTSAVLLMLVTGIRDRFTPRQALLTGFLLGLAVLTKSTSIVLLPVVAFAMIVAIDPRHVSEWFRRGALSAVVFGLLVAPWYAYLYRTYGNLDALDQVKEMQQPWNHPAGTFWGMLSDSQFAWARWAETWGRFGWRRIPLDNWLLWVIAVPVLFGLAGLVVYTVRAIRLARDKGIVRIDDTLPPSRFQAIALVTLLLTCVFSYLAIIQFGTEFALTQARYLFPAVNAATILILLGLRTLTPRQLRPFVQAVLVAGAIALTLVIYTQYVIPYWYLTDWNRVS